ncbi:MAG: prolyl oligopeptidase family serine peptidase [Kiloniellales bacterium]|nr:prolyl oligopeptidase family serine peptidase [Kiloniellales bacterium]
MQFTLAWTLLLLSLGNGAEAGRSYTVDDLLRLENIGAVVFDPSARFLFIERLAAYETAPDYGRILLQGKDRSIIEVRDLSSTDTAGTPAISRTAVGHWLGEFSPDGSRTTVYGLKDGVLRLGILSLADLRTSDRDNAQPHMLQISPNFLGRAFTDHLWLSENEIIVSTLAEGHQPNSVAVQRRTAEELPGHWRKAWAGKETTSNALGSGIYTAADRAEGTLTLFDLSKNKRRSFGRGEHVNLALSPSGRFLAAVRLAEDILPRFGEQLDHHLERRRHELVVYDLENGFAELLPCQMCSALGVYLSWSASERLLFIAKQKQGRWSDSQYHIYSPLRGATTVIDVGGLAIPNVGRSQFGPKPFWVGDDPILPLTSANLDGRVDWYQYPKTGIPSNLTAEFRTTPSIVAGQTSNAALANVSGEIWLLDADGGRTNLSSGIESPLSLWNPQYTRTIDREGFVVAVKIADERGSQGLVILDLQKDRIAHYDVPSRHHRLKALSADGELAVFIDSSSNSSHVDLVELGGQTTTVLTINHHLEGIAFGPQIKLDHADSQKRPLVDWLLLPPANAGQKPYPVVAFLYPGSVKGPNWPTTDEPWSFHPLNPYVLAGRDYAVLLPSLPLPEIGAAANPAFGLADRVLNAINRASAAGHVDPDRIAVMGHSFGGYGALAVATQTSRFRAVIASAAPTNLFSTYGNMDIRRRMQPLETRPSFWGAWWLEAYTGRMAAPPWQAVDRYLQNSPIFQVEEIETPVLLTHGDLDFLSIAQSEEFFTALYRLNKDAQFVRYWGEGHVLTSPANIRDYWVRVFSWLDKYVGSDNASAQASDTISRPNDEESD